MIVKPRGTERPDSPSAEVESLRQEVEALGYMLADRDRAIYDLQRWLATVWDGTLGGDERGEVPAAQQVVAPPDDLLMMLPDLYEYILQRDEEIQTAISAFQTSLETLQQHTFNPNPQTAHQGATSSRRLSYKEYAQLIERIRLVVTITVSYGSTVIVVSKGDDELLKLDGRRAWHFPQLEDGTYAGYYPESSAEAIGHLEALRAKGADFLLFPNTAFWWLEHYSEFRQHLETHYRLVTRQEDSCAIFALRDLEPAQLPTTGENERLRYHQLIRRIKEIVGSILPADATVLVVSKGDGDLLNLGGLKAQHFPQTDSGEYAGHYPKDSAAAIAQLEDLRSKGADYLLFPATAFWWSEYYREFTTHLKKHYRTVVQQRYLCVVYSLKKKGQAEPVQGDNSILDQQKGA